MIASWDKAQRCRLASETASTHAQESRRQQARDASESVGGDQCICPARVLQSFVAELNGRAKFNANFNGL